VQVAGGASGSCCSTCFRTQLFYFSRFFEHLSDHCHDVRPQLVIIIVFFIFTER
jgi:hypothetical protein